MRNAVKPMTDDERHDEMEMIQRILRECQHHEEQRVPEGAPVVYVCVFGAIITCLGTALALSAWVF